MSHLEKLQINITVLVKISDTFNVSIDQLILGRNREVGDLDSKHAVSYTHLTLPTTSRV